MPDSAAKKINYATKGSLALLAHCSSIYQIKILCDEVVFLWGGS